MNLKPVYRGCKYLLVVSVILVVIAGGMLVWLLAGERDISDFNQYFADMLSENQTVFTASIASSELRWDSWSRPAVIVLKDIDLKRADDVHFTTIPSVTITIDLIEALMGEIVPEQVTLQAPKVQLLQNKDQQWFLLGDEGTGIPLESLIPEDHETAGSGTLPFKALSVENAMITYYSESADVWLKFSPVALDWVQGDEHKQHVAFAFTTTLNENTVNLNGKAIYEGNTGRSTALVSLNQTNLMAACMALIDCEPLPKLDMPLTGQVALRFAESFEPEEVVVSLKGQKGSFAFAPHFAEAFEVSALDIAAKVRIPNRQVEVERLEVTMGETVARARMVMSEAEEGKYHVALEASAENMPVNDLYKYWPQNLAPETRTWATTNIRDGIAPEAGATITLKPEDFENEYFPDEFLKAYVSVKDTTVKFIETFPLVKGVNGRVDFTGTTMVADVKSGKALTGTSLSSAKITLPDLNHPKTPVKVDLALKSNAPDVVAFIQPPRFNVLEGLDINAGSAKGQAEGTITLGFDAFGNDSQGSRINWDLVDYDIDSRLNHVSNITFNRKITISSTSGTFKASNDALSFVASGNVNGTPLHFGYKEGKKTAPTYTVNGNMDKALLELAGLPKSIPVDGVVGVNAMISEYPDSQSIKADLDLTSASLNIQELNYTKPLQESAKLSINTEAGPSGKPSDTVTFEYRSSLLNTSGKARLTLASQKLHALDLHTIRYGKNNISLVYRDLSDGQRIDLKGKSVDISQFVEDKNERTISNFPSLRLNLDVKEIYLPKDRKVTDVKGHIHCSSVRCESANVSATLNPKGKMQLAIFRENGKRHFRLQSDDAGNLFRAFDAVEDMYEGMLDIKGEYDDTKKGNPLVGRFILTDYILKDAPLLGRVLNMSSLSGMKDTLSGDGMKFDKLSADFVFAGDVASLKNGKATGPSMGILADGEIGIRTGMMDLRGSLAPVYVLNSVIGKIPLIGEMLVGGEGEGVFAFNYTVRGTYDNPDVSVNPLSVLTPGFTRKFFDIFQGEAVDVRQEAPATNQTAPHRPTVRSRGPVPLIPHNPDAAPVPEVQSNELAPVSR